MKRDSKLLLWYCVCLCHEMFFVELDYKLCSSLAVFNMLIFKGSNLPRTCLPEREHHRLNFPFRRVCSIPIVIASVQFEVRMELG